MNFVDLKAQQRAIKDALDRRIAEVLEHGRYIMGPEVEELEGRLAEYTGASHCITVSSGTDALFMTLMALGIGPGDEVITTPFTFIASVEVIALIGATPVVVDIERDTCNIDASLIEAAISPRTRAIMPVSLYGQPSDMNAINSIAASNTLPVIEDAAQSFGATIDGVYSGNLSTVGCTSFFPSKPLGCYGDGGAIFTDDQVLADVLREIRVHGQRERYRHERIGIGGRMDTLQCAIVLAKLENFAWEIKERQRIGRRYDELFDQHGIERIAQRPGRTSVYAQYTVMVDRREDLRSHLAGAGVPTAIHYPIPVTAQPAYQGIVSSTEVPVSESASQRVLSLPMHAWLTDDEQLQIVNLIARFK